MLCIAVAVLWVVSWYYPRCITIERPGSASPKGGTSPDWSIQIYSMRGGLDLRRYWRSGATVHSATPISFSSARVGNPRRFTDYAGQSVWDVLGCYWTTGMPGGNFFVARSTAERVHVTFIGVSYGVLLIIFAAWPMLRGALAYRCHRKLSAAPSGICTACGYDLRATPGRCPECGTVSVAGKPAGE